MLTDISEVLAVSINRAMMEAASTSEMSVNFYQATGRNNPEDSHLYTRHRENLKSHVLEQVRGKKYFCGLPVSSPVYCLESQNLRHHLLCTLCQTFKNL
jgi:hypothetical protein